MPASARTPQSPTERLARRVALISGGAGGIGSAISRLFAAEGARVIIAERNIEAGESLAKEIRNSGGAAIFAKCDVTQSSDCESSVARAEREFGALHILINNAGIVRRATVVDQTEEDWDRVMAVNLKAAFLLSKFAIPAMRRAGGGSIVNISSGWGIVGGPKAVSYCASKGGLVQMTRAMAIDHAAENIRVNCVCPGDTDTPMLRGEAAQLGQPVNEFLAQAASRPMGRIGSPDEIAQAVLFLASDAASFITGASLLVDGGGLAGG